MTTDDPKATPPSIQAASSKRASPATLVGRSGSTRPLSSLRVLSLLLRWPRLGGRPRAAQPEKATQKQRRGGTFQPGQSGNPAGKPKGAKNHATRLVEALLDGQAHALGQRAIELAMGGDASVMRALLDRLVAPRKDRSVSLTMPKIKSADDLIAAAAALTDATAAGDVTPSEAASLSTLVGNVAKAIETVEIVARLTRLEEQLAVKGITP